MLMVKCDYLHVFCPGSAPCPYCIPVYPLRFEDGTFAPNRPSPSAGHVAGVREPLCIFGVERLEWTE